MTVTCTATFHQGDERLEWVGVGRDHVEAFISAAARGGHLGVLPSPENRDSAVALLRLHIIGSLQLTDSWAVDGHAHIRRGDNDEPEVSIGWVTYRFTRQVRLWAVQAQVHVEGKGGYSSSRQVPTFYLDPVVQGITDGDHARVIAFEILETAGPVDGKGVSLTVSIEPVY